MMEVELILELDFQPTALEVQMLSNILTTKFDLDCTIQKIGIVDKYSIYIKGSSVPTLMSVTTHSSFYAL